MLGVLGFIGLVFVVETLAAGNLLRRRERVHRMIGPYFELVIPAMTLTMMASAVSYRFAVGEFSRYAGLLLVISLLALAVTGVLRRWHWILRVCLHAGWVGALFTWMLVRRAPN
jgi:hypothetical protein